MALCGIIFTSTYTTILANKNCVNINYLSFLRNLNKISDKRTRNITFGTENKIQNENCRRNKNMRIERVLNQFLALLGALGTSYSTINTKKYRKKMYTYSTKYTSKKTWSSYARESTNYVPFIRFWSKMRT